MITSGIDTVTDLGDGADVVVVDPAATLQAVVSAAWTATADSVNNGTARLVTQGMAVSLLAVTSGLGWMVESTSLANTNRQYVKGLGDHEATFSLLVSYASGNSYATIQPLVGTNCYAEFTPTDAAVSATNPKVSITDCLLESFTPVISSLGELGVYEITLRGGDIAYATS